MPTASLTAPTPHDLSELHRLEGELARLRLLAKGRAADLVRVWDRIDAGESFDDGPARRAVAAANDAVEDAQRAWTTEWKRIGRPL